MPTRTIPTDKVPSPSVKRDWLTAGFVRFQPALTLNYMDSPYHATVVDVDLV